MKNPNGYGNISKLPGNRRKPYRVRKSDGSILYDRLYDSPVSSMPSKAELTELLPNGKKRFYEKRQFLTIGYYATKAEALQALAEYNASPYDMTMRNMTLEDLYERWSEEHYEEVSASNVTGCKAAWKICKPIEHMKLQEIKLDHLQSIVDNSGKNTPTLRKLKIMLNLMFKYALQHEYIDEKKLSMIQFIRIDKPGNPNAIDREPFSNEEIDTLWKLQDSSLDIRIILILIYTGCRIGELLEVKKQHVHFEERWFYIAKAKTNAGIRRVPIAEKIYPFLLEFNNQSETEYLISPKTGYDDFRRNHWNPITNKLNMKHTPHDTRHTCNTLLAESGVDIEIRRKILGHRGKDVNETVYTHYGMQILLDAINKI